MSNLTALGKRILEERDETDEPLRKEPLIIATKDDIIRDIAKEDQVLALALLAEYKNSTIKGIKRGIRRIKEHRTVGGKKHCKDCAPGAKCSKHKNACLCGAKFLSKELLRQHFKDHKVLVSVKSLPRRLQKAHLLIDNMVENQLSGNDSLFG